MKEEKDNYNSELKKITDDLENLRESMIEICGIIAELKQFNVNNNSTTQTDNSTHNNHIKPLNDKYLGISIGNDGAQTDKQTNRQTDRIEKNEDIFEENSINNTDNILSSLDNIKKEIRLKFKRLTKQELLIFSKLYELDSKEDMVTYKTIANELRLSESSIRDYISRLTKKNIPIHKERINNKNIKLSISEKLRKVATLSTILNLREI